MRLRWCAIIFFYTAVVIVAVLLLAGVQVRAPAGTAYDMWRLKVEANEELRTRLTDKEEELRRTSTDNLDKLDGANLCLTFYKSDGSYREGIDEGLLAEAKEARAKHADYANFKDELYCLVRGYMGLLYDRSFYEKMKDAHAAAATALKEDWSRNAEELSNLLKERSEFLAYKQMERRWHTNISVALPYDLMVLLLVMFMGALGGMVRLLRDYGDPARDNPGDAVYFFIPLIGLVVAIGGYILAKTGLLLLSSAKEETSLSPFMIGLVGIISGLLAKDVIDALARAGKNIVQEGPEPPDDEDEEEVAAPATTAEPTQPADRAALPPMPIQKPRRDDYGLE
jgi:hypothetical protein